MRYFVSYGYPLMLDLSGKLAVVIGGGGVALRKVSGLMAGGAGVRVVAPNVSGELPAGVEYVQQEYAAKWLEGASLAFAATDSAEVNAAVVRDARGRGILVNRADAEDGEAGDFSVPAVHRDGGVMLAVSAGGSPAVAVRVRDELAGKLEQGWGELAAINQALRSRVMEKVADAARRREILRSLAGSEALAAVRRGGTTAVEAWLASVFPEMGGGGRA